MARKAAKTPKPPKQKKAAKPKPAKAPKPARKAAGIGDNSIASAEAIRRHHALIAKATKVKDEAVSALRIASKRAKDDGVDVRELKDAAEALKSQTVSILRAHNTKVHYMRALSVPAAEQMNLFDELDGGEITPDRVEKEAKQEGEAAAMRGESFTTSPHDPNSMSGRAWAAGWEVGQGKMRGAMAEKMTDANAKAEAAVH